MTEPATEQTEKAPTKTAVEKAAEKPMGATQRRDLAKLIDNDFDSIKGDIGVFVNELKMNRLRQIEEEFAGQEERARQVQREWHEFAAGLRRQADDWLTQKRAEGFIISGEGSYGRDQPVVTNNIKVSVPAKDRAIKDVDNLVSHQKMTAMQALERKRIQMQRDLLLEGLVSSRAKELLAGMPDPREMISDILANARQAGIGGPVLQQIEGVVERHDHGDPQRVYVGEILDEDDVDA